MGEENPRPGDWVQVEELESLQMSYSRPQNDGALTPYKGLSAWQNVLDEAEGEIRKQSSENEALRTQIRVMEWRLQNRVVEGHGMGPERERLGSESPEVDSPDSRNGAGGRGRGSTSAPLQDMSVPPPDSFSKANRQNGQSGELVEAPGHRKWGSMKPSGDDGEQALLMSSGMVGWLQHELRKRERELAAARVQEAHQGSENRTLQRRVAEMRLAHDQQQQGLLDASAKALAYRKEVLDENLRLNLELERAESERAVYVSALLPLVAEFGLSSTSSNAHQVVHNVKALVHRLMGINERGYVPVLPAPWTQSSLAFEPYRPPTPPPPQTSTSPYQPTLQNQNQNQSVPTTFQSQSPPPHHQNPAYAQPYAQPQGSPGISFQPHPQTQPQPQPEIQPQHYNMQTQPPASPDFRDAPRGTPWAQVVHRVTTGGSLSYDEGEVGVGLRTPTAAEPEEDAEEEDARPAIEGFLVLGSPEVGEKLQACGHSTNGTALCWFGWLRQYADGTEVRIDGASSSEYVLSAEDCGCVVAIECLPEDKDGVQGELVRVEANDGRPIQIDPRLQGQLAQLVADGGTAFEVVLVEEEGASPDNASGGFILQVKRLEYVIKKGRKAVYKEMYAAGGDFVIRCSRPRDLYILTAVNRKYHLQFLDHRQRDVAVLLWRSFKEAANQIPANRRVRNWFR